MSDRSARSTDDIGRCPNVRFHGTDLVFATWKEKKIESFESYCVKSRQKSATICGIIKPKTDLEFKMPELSVSDVQKTSI